MNSLYDHFASQYDFRYVLGHADPRSLIPNAQLPSLTESKPFCSYLYEMETRNDPLSPLTVIAPGFPPIFSQSPVRKTHLMAILNLTPDSFSDGGLHSSDPSTLLPTLQAYLSAGMTILDIGGQSTRPHAPQISLLEEASRVLPAIEFVRSRREFDNVVISIDTYRASVAEAAVKAGANIVNDVSAGQADRDMLSTVARLGCTIVLMHMRGTPRTMTEMTSYPRGLFNTIGLELGHRIQLAEQAGIPRWRIILDPGVGFAKNHDQNLMILKDFSKLTGLRVFQGFPWLVGTSRKGFIGTVLGEREATSRIWGTAAAVTAAIQAGADIVRVHDVEEMGKVVKMADAIWRSNLREETADDQTHDSLTGKKENHETVIGRFL